MKFNKWLWENYKQTEDAKVVEVLLKNIQSQSSEEKTKNLFEYLNQYRPEPFEEDFVEYVHYLRGDLFESLDKNFDTNIRSEDEAYNFLQSIWLDEFSDSEGEEVFIYSEDIVRLSSVLYQIAPEYFFPYFYERQFYLLQRIFKEFDIPLPKIPKKNDIDARFYYYWELCQSLRKFTDLNSIEFQDVGLFLYGFAGNMIAQNYVYDQFPEPKRAFFVGGGKNDNGDFEHLDKANELTVTVWQGNPDTEPGDIIVMYCLSPRSYIHSIWRAVSPGFIDPFFYFYKCVYLGRPELVSAIKLNDIKNDDVLSKYPLVRGNMQGINGRKIPKKYYNRILEMLVERGNDMSNTPKLDDIEFDEVDISNERDVEMFLLEPLLVEFGYERDSWKRQVPIKTGQTKSIYSDYVIYPKEDDTDFTAHWIWEAKKEITTNKAVKKAFDQAKTYARLLQCKGLGLVSKEGIWLCESDFNFKKIKKWTWDELKQRDIFNEVYKIAGNRR